LGFKRLLVSFHKLKPDGALFGALHIRSLPAICWKLMNLEHLQTKQPEKYRTMIQHLETMLSND
jgi:hypothetical protein